MRLPEAIYLKHGLLGFILTILSLSFIQQQFKLLKEKPLLGAFNTSTEFTFDSLNIRNWFDGSFQNYADKTAETGIGFRKSLIRIHNQTEYSIFRKANAEGVLVGKKGELFEKDYIRAVRGDFFVGENVWKEKARKLKAVQDTLEKLHKQIVIIFEPGKGTVYSDRIPDNEKSQNVPITNNDIFKRELLLQGVKVIDLNPYFVSIREKASNRIFPRGGTHWSYYGAALAADSVLRYLKEVSQENVATFTIDKVVQFDSPRHPDADIWQAMNLIESEPNDQLGYPVILFDHSKPAEADVLVVGDSFYFNWQSDSIMYKAFGNCDFWYYNKHWWNRNGLEAGIVSSLDRKSEIMKRDIILIMITERFHHNFAWGFDEEIYHLFYPSENDAIGNFANTLRCSNDQFMRLVDDAKMKKMSLEQRIDLEAQYLLYEDFKKHPEKYSRKEELLPILMMSIRQTPDWLAKVQKKAEEKNIPLDEMIRRDAEWIYNEKYGKKNP